MLFREPFANKLISFLGSRCNNEINIFLKLMCKNGGKTYEWFATIWQKNDWIDFILSSEATYTLWVIQLLELFNYMITFMFFGIYILKLVLFLKNFLPVPWLFRCVRILNGICHFQQVELQTKYSYYHSYLGRYIDSITEARNYYLQYLNNFDRCPHLCCYIHLPGTSS